MPAQQPHLPIGVDSPVAMLAVVPHLLGFTPTRSLVVVGGRGPRQRIEVTLRFDLPDPPHQATAQAIAEHTVSVLARHEFTTAVVIGYGPGDLVAPLTGTLRDAITQTGLEIRARAAQLPDSARQLTTVQQQLQRTEDASQSWLRPLQHGSQRLTARTMAECIPSTT